MTIIDVVILHIYLFTYKCEKRGKVRTMYACDPYLECVLCI